MSAGTSIHEVSNCYTFKDTALMYLLLQMAVRDQLRLVDVKVIRRTLLMHATSGSRPSLLTVWVATAEKITDESDPYYNQWISYACILYLYSINVAQVYNFYLNILSTNQTKLSYAQLR